MSSGRLTKGSQPPRTESGYSLWEDRVASDFANTSRPPISQRSDEASARHKGKDGNRPINMSGVATESDRRRAVMHALLQKLSLRDELEKGLVIDSTQATDISSISNQEAENNTLSHSWIDILARNTQAREDEYIGERFDAEPSVTNSMEARSIGSNGEEFFRRVTEWQQQKEKESEMKRRMQENHRLADCTFKPHVERKRSTSTEVPISERLYKEHEERLRLLQQRQHIRMQDLDIDCTFHPHIQSKRLVTESRYKTPQHLRMSIKEPELSTEEKNLSECTFTPKILKKPSKSTALEKYLSKDPFERLSSCATKKISKNHQSQEAKSQPTEKPDKGEEKFFDDDSLFRPFGSMYISQTETERMEREQQDLETTNQLRREAFENFLRRQTEHCEKTKQKIEVVHKNSQEDIGHPSICERSRKIAEQKGDFTSRLDDYLKRRKEYETKRKHGLNHSHELSFKPQITNMGKKMPSRNPEDRSLGDYYRLEVARESAKIHVEAERKAEATFKPSTNTSIRSNSTLNIRADPEGYIERLRTKEKSQQEVKKRIKERKEREEMLECTFNPETHSAPMYVQRVARSMTQMKITSPAAPPPNDPIPWRY